MNGYSKFPFHYLKYPLAKEMEQEETPFAERVKLVLSTDLQKYDDFGCKINDCHTHAGSKIHFENFIEAELLFHNNYYNEHFAQLTVKEIKQIFKKHHDVKKLLIIGYENYSELYLQKVKGLICQEKSNISAELEQCVYCVYETNSRNEGENTRVQETTIKYLVSSKTNENQIRITCGNEIECLKCDETICVFIVPINTSLSTMDKMVAKFCADTKIDNFKREHICLITLGPKNSRENNEYWTAYENGTLLIPNQNRFEYIKNNKILNLIYAETDWAIGKKCKKCFPDLNENESIEQEQPMFGVNRGSVVPMLKIGQKKYLPPINEDISKDKEKNLNHIWQLSEYMTYGHLVRNDNHFQYYFSTDKFLQSYKLHHTQDQLNSEEKKRNDSIRRFFHNIRNNLERDLQEHNDSVVFEFIVAPRHRTNAEWVHFVNEFVFQGKARIMYFDMEKEYRSNILSKYSDFVSTLNNIWSSKQNFYIRFHFVDDMINSGTTFLRAKNLITSLCYGKESDGRISLFNSIILLVNRLSLETQRFYLDNNNFFKFVDVNISSMRKHDDACTLCKMIYDYQRTKEECATNNLAKMCYKVIERHKERDVLEFEMPSKSVFGKLEKRYIFFISHLLAERVSNKLFLGLDKKADLSVIDSESNSLEIKEILKIYYDHDNAQNIISEYCSQKDEEGECISDDARVFLWKVAFIKTISRPFFIYHIRQRQASFSFCIEKLSELLKNENIEELSQKMCEYEIDKEYEPNYLKKLILLQTFVKSLSDMNANYLIRKEVLDKLIQFAMCGNKLYEKCEQIRSKILKELIEQCDEDCFDKKEKIEKINKINKIMKGLLTEEALLHYLKKSIILSRDASKSVLLEHILLTGEEDKFFGEEQPYLQRTVNKFTKNGKNSNKELTLEGAIYLENNTVLKDILAKEDNLIKFEKIIDINEPMYFFSNFLEIWELNTPGFKGTLSKDSVERVFNAYNELAKCIDGFKTKNNNNESKNSLCSKMDRFFDALLKQGEICTQFFIYDKTESNKLFKFFTIEDNPAKDDRNFQFKYENDEKRKFPELTITQAFYYDENLKKIGEIINDSQNWTVCFIEDSLKYNGEERTAIVKFENIENEKNIDESIYVQIWGFDTKNLTHWFALKLLLTLRKNFIDLINRINLMELIEERKVDMQKNALNVNKATTHADSEKYFKEIIYLDYPKMSVNGDCVNGKFEDLRPFTKPDESLRKQYAQAMASSEKNYQFMLYDTYYQLLSDEFISSLYRSIIRGKKLFAVPDNMETYDTVKGIVQKHFCMNEITGDVVKTQLYLVKHGDEIELYFHNLNITDKDKKKECNAWQCTSGIYYISHIINLMAMNVSQHGELENGKYVINIYFEENSISFKNKISGDPEKINNDILIYTHIPPWIFSQNHITLWTLVQAELIDDNSEEETKIKVNVKANNGEFVVEFNNLIKESNKK